MTPEITGGNDGETEALRLVIGERSVSIGTAIAFPGGVLYYLSGARAVGILWMAFAATLIGCRWLFAKQHLSFRAWVYWSTWPLLVTSFVSVPLLGGVTHSNAVIVWAFVAPMLNLTMLGVNESRRFFAAYFICLIAAVVIPSGSFPRPAIPDWLDKVLFLVNFGAASTFLVVIFHFFINEIERFRKQSDELLLNILPREVAALLKREHRVIADAFDNVSVMFADVAGFTPMSAGMSPVELVQLLNEVFSCFDQLVDKYGVEKIKTIGDCYMAAAGVPLPRADHAEVLANLALDMRDLVETRTFGGQSLRLRIGINSGPAVAGVIGHKKFIYDLWSDAVNTASRMESHGVPGCIQITEATYNLIKDKFVCVPKGAISVKGKGQLEAWHLLRARPE